MACKLITYDLNGPVKDYPALYKAIKALGPWWHRLDSTWLVDTPLSVNEVTNRVKTAIDDNDWLLVIDVRGDSHQGWLQPSDWEWINARM